MLIWILGCISLFKYILRNGIVGSYGSSPVAQTVKNVPAMWETWVQYLGREDPLEKEMATHSSILAWRIPWTEEPGRLQSMGSQRAGHDGATSVVVLVFWGTSKMFSTVATPIYIPTSSIQSFPFLHILPAFVGCVLFDDDHSGRCEVTCHCGFDVHFPDN